MPKRKGIEPRRDAEAMRIMAEREVIRSAEDKMNIGEIIELLKSTSFDWGVLAQEVMPQITEAIAKDKVVESKRRRHSIFGKTPKYVDIKEI